MKDKLISAEKLFTVLREDININGANLARVKRHIDAAPTVDAVEVVRCEKCRYYEKAEYDDGYKMVCRLLKRQTAYNGFCYCGAKMDGGNEDG